MNRVFPSHDRLGEQANVNAIPAGSAAAEIFPGHKNNYFYVPMGLVTSALPLQDIAGADNGRYDAPDGKYSVHSMIQGVITNGVNTFRMASLLATLAIPDYIVHLPSSL